jgi:hypothetical protein
MTAMINLGGIEIIVLGLLFLTAIVFLIVRSARKKK